MSTLSLKSLVAPESSESIINTLGWLNTDPVQDSEPDYDSATILPKSIKNLHFGPAYNRPALSEAITNSHLNSSYNYDQPD